MSKLIILLTLLALSSTTLSKNAWECDDNGKLTCDEQSTCCPYDKSVSGYYCFPETEGTCCNNRACKNGEQCIENSFCRKTQLFLFAENDESRQGYDPKDSAALFYGFMDGIAIFNNLPHAGRCSDKDFEAINKEVDEIVDILRTLEFNYEIVTKIGQLKSKVTQLYESFDKIVGPCQEYARELESVMKNVVDRVRSVTYLAQLPVHLIMELGNLKSKASNAREAYNQKQYREAGVRFGDLLHLALLWEF
jgi:signal recognition particle subunit SEC65